MQVLVTGAHGFLGRHVVDALRAAGHGVRALSRSSRAAVANVEAVQADLLDGDAVARAADGVDAVIHLALDMHGSPAALRRSALDGTRHLVAAMPAGTRLVLASSFSVYDWRRMRGALNEDSPLVPPADAPLFGAYAETKLAQEALARALCAARGIGLTLLRPAMIWGEGRRGIDVVGPRVGGRQVVVAPGRTTQLTHVRNCADAFVAALACTAPVAVFNVEDGLAIGAADFARMLDPAARTLAVPAWTTAALATLGPLARWACRRGLPVPGLLIPERVAARFAAVAVDTSRLRSELGWTPRPLPLERAA